MGQEKIRRVIMQSAAKLVRPQFQNIGRVFFFLNHTAFKLNSLWHVGYLRDSLYGFYLCSRVSL